MVWNQNRGLGGFVDRWGRQFQIRSLEISPSNPGIVLSGQNSLRIGLCQPHSASESKVFHRCGSLFKSRAID